ncbi:MAG: class I SAM-dependent methyltransferase [Candidatus Hermodarchaeota archaeon]
MDYEEAINNQYGQFNLGIKIISLLKSKGIEDTSLVQEILAPIEELHLLGRKATLELAQEVNIDKNMKILDVGSGLGGSARTLVSNFGCNVIGIDLSEEFCHAADLINELLGYAGNIEIQKGDALNMPFDDNSFDITFIQYVSMNIKNKKRLISEIYRILRPRGRFVIHTICAGLVEPIHFPVFWADNPDISFLSTPDELHQLISKCGFKELLWRDDTIRFLNEIQIRRSNRSSNTLRSISSEVWNLIHTDPRIKWKNGIRNLEEERTVVYQGIFEHK